MTHAKNPPAPLSKMLKPMWLASLGLHGLLLAIPIPVMETPKPIAKPQELVKLTSITPSPSPVNRVAKPKPTVVKPKPTPVANNRPIPPQRRLATTTVEKSPSPTSPKIVPSPQPQITPPPTPVAINPFPQSTEIELDTKNQELLPPPQVIPSVSPSPVTIATSAINGVPVDPNWQVVDRPNEAIAEAKLFTQPDGKLHPDIVGKVAQIPDKNPDAVFEEFFVSQLQSANFTVEPTGTYGEGGGLYKLTPKDDSPTLYLALAPDKQGTGTVVTIWNKYPSPIESSQ